MARDEQDGCLPIEASPCPSREAPSSSPQQGWLGEQAGAQLAGLACLLLPGCEWTTVPHPTASFTLQSDLSCFFHFL